MTSQGRDTRLRAPFASTPDEANWGAVVAVAVTVASIIVAELLPASLLTPLARDLGVTEGVAGQTVTATALAAMVASLFVTAAIRGVDRRRVLMAFSAMLIASSVITALATDLLVLMLARVLLGVALGGFWALAASLAMRLVPSGAVPRALSIIFAGISVAMVVGAPLGSLLSGLIGWRGVFFGAAGLGTVCLVWQSLVLPPMPAGKSDGLWGPFRVMVRPGVVVAMAALFCVFTANMAFFAYVRPLLETKAGLGLAALSGVLLLFGLGNFLGTSLSGVALKHSLKATLLLAPLLLAAAATGMMASASVPVIAMLVAIWGFLFGAIPVGWSSWVAQNLGDDAENAGGLQVAVIQLANTAGAACGGIAFDHSGANGTLALSGALMLASSIAVGMTRAPTLRERSA